MSSVDMSSSDDEYHHSQKQIPRDLFYTPPANHQIHNIVLIAALLSSVFTASIFSVPILYCYYGDRSNSGFYQLGVYVSLLCIFHFLEFYITARYNPTRVSVNSFLLNNGLSYNIAQLVAFLEALLGYYFFPQKYSRYYLISWIGLIATIVGQLARSLAMIHASSNFNHVVQRAKHQDHELVTSGIYGISRHPSYFGFFYWSLGLQMFMLNPVSFLGFSIVLWRFFSDRIKDEERHLIKFFGDEYIAFKSNTRTLIPFIR